MSDVLVNIGTGNAQSPAWCKAIIGTNADIELMKAAETNLCEIWVISIEANMF